MSTFSNSPPAKRNIRPPTSLLVAGFVVLVLGTLLAILLREPHNVVPPINPAQPADGGLAYPFSLVPGQPVLDFPAAEGRLRQMDSDTWFLEGVLQGRESGRRFSFIVVYYVSRIGGVVPFNFYSLTFYDLDEADYGTFTHYDMHRLKAAQGYLDLSMPIDGEHASWTTVLDDNGYLIPYTYHVNLIGVDQHGRRMQLTSDVRPLNPPVAVGADVYNGRITVLKQPDTFSYFQTGIQFDGVLSWGDFSEAVTGSVGHIDRQMFPRFSGATSPSWDARDLSHEWRTYFLENGLDLSSWRQFDRLDGNSEYSYSGATVYSPAGGARYIDDIVYENLSYIRVEDHPVKPLLPARSKVLYYPSRHRLTSAALQLELEVEPIVHAPLLAFPVEYMHGPAWLRGSLAGEPIEGVGSFELTLHLYRDFELVTVLSDSVKHLPAAAILPESIPVADILNTVVRLDAAVARGESSAASAIADGPLRTELLTLAEPYRGDMLQIVDDLVAALGKS